MKKKQLFNYLLLALISLFLLTGCPGPADYDIDLPGGYSVIRTSAHQVKIAPKTSDTSWGSDVIPTKVTEVAWDDNYIIAKQLGLKEDDDSSNGYQIPDKENVHFWILEIKTGKVTGPLDDDSFMEKKAELKISKNVVLKEINDIR
ncbi:DUF3997 domain-containing protein [Domibacillus aminovorans]|uniref:DUF3997 domain-containing protein n=1 Tax=Domibacillus aminovorans TaxID=29332 RepID=A0A177L379_9BACI|nr:DUF3997 domain-containing protein [Domibacillus aminovorans]OAH59854.1 hypothetical protein AWH49_18190 [Domibacillus aminovorans]